MSFGIQLKAGWRCIRECLSEFAGYAGILSPVVIPCNHYASVKPTLERVEREVLEAHNSVTREVWTADDVEEFQRRTEAFVRRVRENNAIMLQIEKLKEELNMREA